jgi:LmbE family N-acetylglucosaminyl deacetylase
VLARAKNYLRRRLRSLQRAKQYPLLLPHHTIADGILRSIDGSGRPLAPAMAKSLFLCDGQRTLARVARESATAKSDLIQAHDDGLLLFWHKPVPVEPPTLPPGHSPHAICLSPHLDDAALSCGGRMVGDPSVLVVNVFSQAAWWRFPHDPAGDAAKIQTCRDAEENLVARLSGCPQQFLDLPEALLRGGRVVADLFTAVPDERDAEVTSRIRDAVTDLARAHPLAHWYLPLGVGDHIDHRITRDAALDALQYTEIKPTHLHFYEDQPYAARMGAKTDFSKKVPAMTLAEDALGIEEDLPWKIELLRAYWSQLAWSDLLVVKNYARTAGGGEAVEITWNPA